MGQEREEQVHKGRMGTLKRRLSAKQKTKGKGVTAPTDKDTFSASAPGGLKAVHVPRSIRSTSL